MSEESAFTVDSVPSSDGTLIGYRRYGAGPAIVLVQAAMGTPQNYHELASILSRDLTVYVPERRGRPLSPAAWDPDRCVEREIEDLQAVLRFAEARMVFGLSSGAVIALESARVVSGIERVMLFEPPLYVPPRRMPADFVGDYYRAIENDDLPAALVAALMASGVAPVIVKLSPRRLAEAVMAIVLRLDARRKRGTDPTLRDLVPSIRFDFSVVGKMQDRLDTFGRVRSKVLLMSGTKSPIYLREACTALSGILPFAHQVQLEQLDHSSPWNAHLGGKPDVVAAQIMTFVDPSRTSSHDAGQFR